ncbi:MAG: hypothetical protein JWQ35_453 [Bacteriovoracaceae bacterium]|nr:hypothetical protein [Bacteriovoracaceae bacterium]
MGMRLENEIRAGFKIDLQLEREIVLEIKMKLKHPLSNEKVNPQKNMQADIPPRAIYKSGNPFRNPKANFSDG